MEKELNQRLFAGCMCSGKVKSRGTECSVFESCSVPFRFFLLSFRVFVSFCLLIWFVVNCFFIYIYTPSRAKIVYLWINNLNFYRFLQFKFLFYCNIFYKTKTKATCSHRLPFIMSLKFVVYLKPEKNGEKKKDQRFFKSGLPLMAFIEKYISIGKRSIAI